MCLSGAGAQLSGRARAKCIGLGSISSMKKILLPNAMHLSYHAVTPLQGIYLPKGNKNTHLSKDLFQNILSRPNWKQLTRPVSELWVTNCWTHTREYKEQKADAASTWTDCKSAYDSKGCAVWFTGNILE